jgi:hypothetical protein
MDPIALSIFSSRIEAVCDEMGAVLKRAAFSPNIKDRLDYSCAVFDAEGELCAQAAHIPVHLGSMAYAMRDIVARLQWRAGDMVAVNDPYLGGTHLPDVTLISPLFVEGELLGFVANRAHHADIGAATPGSMPISASLEEEGLIIPPTHLYRGGEQQGQVMTQILAAVTAAVTSLPRSAPITPGWRAWGNCCRRWGRRRTVPGWPPSTRMASAWRATAWQPSPMGSTASATSWTMTARARWTSPSRWPSR